jgi:hypothetical protein
MNYIKEDLKSSKETYINFLNPNSKGESLVMCISHCEAYGTKSLPHLWFENGHTDKEINKYLICNCYVTSGGICFDKYNPQLTVDHKINFEWLLEDTEENVQKFINEVERRFYN